MKTASTEGSDSRSVRPDPTSTLKRRTGLDEVMIANLVHGFHAKVRRGKTLGPIFAEPKGRLAARSLHPCRLRAGIRHRVPGGSTSNCDFHLRRPSPIPTFRLKESPGSEMRRTTVTWRQRRSPVDLCSFASQR